MNMTTSNTVTITYILVTDDNKTQESMYITRSLLADVLMAMIKAGVQIEE